MDTDTTETPHPADWQRRVDALWDAFDTLTAEDFLARMRMLVAERPTDDPQALFEQAGAFDSCGRTAQAVPLYERALALGLAGSPRRQATVQLASSLRALGDVARSIALLEAERAAGSDALDDAVSGFLALALASAGREREAVAIALTALAPHLPMYRRSLANYARALAHPSVG